MIRIAIVGAGLVGQRHVDAAQQVPGVGVCAVADPSANARAAVADICVTRASLRDIIERDKPDGVVLASPTTLHLAHALEAVAAGLPVLIEKPITATVDEGQRLMAAAKAAAVPLLVGHHRRHNPIIASAKAAIEAGRLGRITAAHATFWLHKPDDYFAAEWRRAPGGGPVMINVIHDVDLLRHLCGPVDEVVAMTASSVRGFAVEDGAAVLMRFASGALGTVNVSDATSAPWSWELTAGENPAYPKTDETSMMIGGTHGSLAVPGNRLWHHPRERSWWSPIVSDPLAVDAADDPLVRQMINFRDVIAGTAQPLVSGHDGLCALAIVEAILESARSQRPATPAVR